MRVSAGDGGAIVAGEKYESVITQALLVQRPHQSAEGVVHLRDIAVMRRQRRRLGVVRAAWPLIRVERREAMIGSDRFVRLVKTDEQEERFRVVAARLQPIDGLVDDKLR